MASSRLTSSGLWYDTPQPNPQASQNINRFRQLQNEQDRYPGARPGGTGETGLTSNDAEGWSRLLERQQELAALNGLKSLNDAPTPLQAEVRQTRNAPMNPNYESTMFDSGQTSAITGLSQPAEKMRQGLAMKGLMGAR